MNIRKREFSFLCHWNKWEDSRKERKGKKKEMLGKGNVFWREEKGNVRLERLVSPKRFTTYFLDCKNGWESQQESSFFLRNEREIISFYLATFPFYFLENIAVLGKAIKEFQNNILLFLLQRRMWVSFAL